jgi:hypothetical protein
MKKLSKARRRRLQEAGRKGGRSRSAKKIAAVIANGKRHTKRVKPLTEIVAEEAEKFRSEHPELFDGVE